MEVNIQNVHQHNLAAQGSRASWVPFTERHWCRVRIELTMMITASSWLTTSLRRTRLCITNTFLTILTLEEQLKDWYKRRTFAPEHAEDKISNRKTSSQQETAVIEWKVKVSGADRDSRLNSGPKKLAPFHECQRACALIYTASKDNFPNRRWRTN